MRCFVTGGTGFVGRHVIRKLRAERLDVLLFARPTSDTREAVKLGCDVFTGDLQDFAAVKNAVSQADAIIHIGEIGMRIKNGPEKNIDLVRTMLQQASDNSAFRRFVFVSSVTTQKTPSGLSINDVYSAYKRNCETAIEQAKAPATIVRGSTIYGPGAHYLVWYTKWLRRAGLFGMPFPGRIDACIPSIHVEDMADALVLAALQKDNHFASYNGSDDAGSSAREFTALLGRLMNMRFRLWQVPLWLQHAAAFGFDSLLGLLGKPPSARSIIDYLSDDSLFDNARMKQDLKIDLKFPTIRQGLPGTASWIAQHW